MLAKVGIDGPLWFNSPSWSKPSLVLLSLWACGDVMIIFVAALLDAVLTLVAGRGLEPRGGGVAAHVRYSSTGMA